MWLSILFVCVAASNLEKTSGSPDPEYLREYINIAKNFLEYGSIILELQNHQAYDQARQVMEMFGRTCDEGDVLLDQYTDEDLQNNSERLTHTRLTVLLGKLLLMKLNLTQFATQYREEQGPLPLIRNVGRGRPRREVTREQLEFLRNRRFKWATIANILRISESTLWRRREEFGMINDNFFSVLNDDELDERVRSIKRELPISCGIGSVQGHLQREGIFLKNARKRIWQSLRRVLPEETAMRMSARIDRRVYWTPGARYMYHMDGNHKMRRYSIVIHGAVDGASRLIIFMRASDNNFSQTVRSLFVEGIRKHGWCENLRTDRGGENVLAGALIERNGGHHFQGSSTHNVRIERLWRDARVYCFSFFIGLFVAMEDRRILDPDNNVDISALQAIYIPRLNRALGNFVEAHNIKPHRSLGNKSPSQQFILSHFKYTPNVPDEMPPEENHIAFGYRLLDITQQEKEGLSAQLLERIPDPCAPANDNGVRFYLRARRVIRNFLLNR